MNERRFRQAEEAYLTPPDYHDPEECETCSGSGQVKVDCFDCEGKGLDDHLFPCDECSGSGKGDDTCDDCDGSGYVDEGARQRDIDDMRADQAYEEYRDRMMEKES